MTAEAPPPETRRDPEAANADARGLFERLRDFLGLGSASVRDDIEDALASPAPSGDFTPHERTLLRNVLQLHDVRVKDVMIPRADVVSLRIESPVAEALETFRTAAHSRLPVYHETLDDPRGMVHIRDLVEFLLPGTEADREARTARPLSEAGVIRPVLYAPPSMPALDLLVRMQASRTHMALVVDEYGGTDGLVSIEDLVEAIVGDIEDEHDETADGLVLEGADGAFYVDARASLEEVSNAMKFDFLAEGAQEDVDTIGGLIIAGAGRVPSRGEILVGPGGFEFEILDADPRRVKRMTIRPALRARAVARRDKEPTPKNEATDK
jgi:CBS domain containing-hemolysin-like protein